MTGSFYARFVEQSAIKSFGLAHQICKFLEETGEVIQAMNKCIIGEDTVEHLTEELADLSVTLEQMVIGFGIEKRFDYYRDAKLDKLWEKILKREGVDVDGEEDDDNR